MKLTLRHIFALNFLIGVTLAMPNYTFAQEPVIIISEQQNYTIKGTQLAYLEDPTGQLTLEQVMSPQWVNNFTVYEGEIPRFAQDESTYWFRLKLLNQTLQTDWRLEVIDANLNYVDMYQLIETTFIHQQAGNNRPLTVKRVPYNYPVFMVDLSKATPQIIYLQIHSKTSIYLPLQLSTHLQFTMQSQSNMFKSGLVMGILFIMLSYNFFIFTTLYDKSYIYYSLFILNLFLVRLAYSGLGDRYIWTLNPERWDALIGRFSGTLVLLFMLQFTRSFLQTRTTAPRLDRALWFLVWSMGVILVLSLASINDKLVQSTLVPSITIFALMLILITGVMVWWDNYRPARYFLLAWSLFILTVVWFFLQVLGGVPTLLIATDLIDLGSVVLVLTLSLALADRIHLLKTTTEQTNRKLHESERRLNQFLEALPVGVVIIHTNQIISYINERAYELFDLIPSPGDIGRSFADAYTLLPPFVAHTNQPYSPEKLPTTQALLGHACYVDDLEVQTSKQRRQIEVWGKPIIDSSGQVEYALCAFQDITKRKRDEAELYQYQHRLEELVASRTEELNRVNAELDRLAYVDGLTQVANRRRFDQYLPQAWQNMAQAQLPLSLILCDIDYFKLYNDTYGHQMGDDALRQVAQAFMESVKRSTDLVARYGGEEFVLVLPRTDKAGVKIVAGYLHERIKQLQIPHVASTDSAYLTVSLGVSSVVPTLEQSPHSLVTAADAALYQAKLQGRNCTVYQMVEG